MHFYPLFHLHTQYFWVERRADIVLCCKDGKRKLQESTACLQTAEESRVRWTEAPHSSSQLLLNLAGNPARDPVVSTRTPSSLHLWPLIHMLPLLRKSPFPTLTLLPIFCRWKMHIIFMSQLKLFREASAVSPIHICPTVCILLRTYQNV